MSEATSARVARVSRAIRVSTLTWRPFTVLVPNRSEYFCRISARTVADEESDTSPSWAWVRNSELYSTSVEADLQVCVRRGGPSGPPNEGRKIRQQTYDMRRRIAQLLRWLRGHPLKPERRQARRARAVGIPAVRRHEPDAGSRNLQVRFGQLIDARAWLEDFDF